MITEALHYCTLQLRLKRGFLLAWLLPLLAIPITFVPAYASYYGDLESRAALVSGMNSNLGTRAMFGTIGTSGPQGQTSTLGQLVSWEGGMFMMILGSVMVILLVLSAYRRPESSSLGELPRSTGLGRSAVTTGSLLLLLFATGIYGLGSFLGFMAIKPQYSEITVQGAIAFGLTMFLVTFASGLFAAFSTLFVNNPSNLTKTGLLTLGIGFLIRAIADTKLSALNAITPLGWMHVFSPFTHNRFWAQGLALVAILAVLAVFLTLDSKRQFSAGLLPEREHENRKQHAFPTPLSFRLLIDRNSRITWAAVLTVLAFFWGLLSGSLADFIKNDSQTGQTFQEMFPNQSIEAAFLTYTSEITAMLASVAVISIVLHYRKEESNGLLQLQRAQGIPRTLPMRLTALSALIAAITIALPAALGAGLGTFLSARDSTSIAVFAHLSNLPAILALAGIASAIIGLLPRLSSFAWLPLALSTALTYFGLLFKVPQKLVDASAFGHTLDSSNLSIKDLVSLAVMLVIAVVGFAVGVWSSGRREVK